MRLEESHLPGIMGAVQRIMAPSTHAKQITGTLTKESSIGDMVHIPYRSTAASFADATGTEKNGGAFGLPCWCIEIGFVSHRPTLA
jgi:hypothetical protein